MKKSDLVFSFLLVPFDLALLMGAAMAAYFVRVSPVVADIRPVLFDLPLGDFLMLSVVISPFFIVLFAISGLYSIRGRNGVLAELASVMIAISAGMMLIIIFMFFRLSWFDSRFIMLAAWAFGIIFVACGRMSIRLIRIILVKYWGIGQEHLVLIGSEKKVNDVMAYIKSNNRDVKIIGLSNTADLNFLKELDTKHTLHHVLIVDSVLARDKIMNVVNFCEEHGIQFSYVTDLFGSLVADMRSDLLDGMPVVSLAASPLDGWGKIIKRLIDITGSSFALIVFSPLFIVVAFAIKWESKGPVFVKLKRISQGREFNLYKFRSMIDNAHSYKAQFAHLNERDEGPLFKVAQDPRITGVGKFLRMRRIDELPQIFNVLRGNISLIGPRPHEPEEVERYQQHHKKVLAIKSGITGFAQISGASDLAFDEEVRLDRHYIENWSLKKDIYILLKTLWMLFFDKSGV